MHTESQRYPCNLQGFLASKDVIVLEFSLGLQTVELKFSFKLGALFIICLLRSLDVSVYRIN